MGTTNLTIEIGNEQGNIAIEITLEYGITAGCRQTMTEPAEEPTIDLGNFTVDSATNSDDDELPVNVHSPVLNAVVEWYLENNHDDIIDGIWREEAEANF